MLDPHLAVGPNGVAVLAWSEDGLLDPRDEESLFTQPWVAYRPAEAVSGKNRPRSAPATRRVDDVAIDAEGMATVAIGGKTLSLLRSNDGTWREDGTFDGAAAELAASGLKDDQSHDLPDLPRADQGAGDTSRHRGPLVRAEESARRLEVRPSRPARVRRSTTTTRPWSRTTTPRRWCSPRGSGRKRQ